jgi:hypothetical protein
MSKKIIGYSCLLLFYFSGFSQSEKALGSWNILNIKYKLNHKWSLFGEAQIRSLQFYSYFHYYEYKGGAAYTLNKYLSVAAGLGNYDTYREGGSFKTPMVNDEFRTWLQLTMQHSIQPVKLEHRYRAEQRWTINGYRNRFRYRLNSTIPLKAKKNASPTLALLCWNELFFTNTAPYFERNRFFAGLSYKINQSVMLQSGYLHQFDYRINDETGRRFLQISLLLEFSREKIGKEQEPTRVID